MRRSRPHWPNGARCAVLVTVNFDGELFWMRHDPASRRRLKTLSMGQYAARRGVERLLTAFAEHDVSASWFVPAAIAERHPGAVRDVVSGGHEVAARGQGLERFEQLDPTALRDVIARARDTLAAACGAEPAGFRPPPGEVDGSFIRALQDAGVVWTSLSRGDDRPYLIDAGSGRPPLVEIPAAWELDDFSQFMFNYDPPYPAGQSRIAPYAQVLADWRDEFTAYHELGLCYVLTLEPQCIGKPGRIALLEEHLAFLRGHDDVWFATGAEVAAWWRSHGPTNAPNDMVGARAWRGRSDEAEVHPVGGKQGVVR